MNLAIITRLFCLTMAACIVCAACTTSVASAEPEPSGKHPRLFLDDAMRAAWKQQAKDSGPVSTAISYCNKAGGGGRTFDNDRYMGFQWSTNVQACLIAWAATGDDAHAKVAIKYFIALLDDRDNVGDGLGGDNTIRRDSGYAIRLIGPTSALAYDWLHDHKLMTEALRAKARGRFQAWLDWYIAHGYRPRSPGTNYHAGYLISATFISIAQGGEAGAYGGKLWKHVVDDLWKGDMTKAYGPGPLAGGDWAEGWQYAPLSVAGYALAGRAMAAAGVEIKGRAEWLHAMLLRHVYALSPGEQTFVGGDVENDSPNLAVNGMSLLAVRVGDAAGTEDARGWSAAEKDRLKLKIGDEFRLYDAIAAAKPVKAVEVPRKDWPTWYLAKGTGNLYARTHWGNDGVWTVMQCTSTIDIDHFHPDAGNFVLSRGQDDAIVDPSPYGTLSTMTSNAPSVESAHLPAEYKPSQAWWSEKTRWHWAHQTRGGVVTARCDYADQYKFQHRPSDVPVAVRDMILVPWNNGRDASLVVLDRAKSGDKKRGLHLRFRTKGALKLSGDTATATVGDTALSIQRVSSSAGTPVLGKSTLKDCFSSGRGNCDAGRFPVSDLRTIVDGPDMEAIHVIDVNAKGGTQPAKVQRGAGWQGVWLERTDGAAMVVYGNPSKSLRYNAPARKAVHVVVDAPADKGGNATVAATAKDGQCVVTITPGGPVSARPAVFALDAACAVTADGVLTGGPVFRSTAEGSPARSGSRK